MQGRILGPVPDGLTVIETMRAERGVIALWPLHLERLGRDCSAVGFPLDQARVTAALTGLPDAPTRVRLTVDAVGDVQVTQHDLPTNPLMWNIQVSDVTLDSDDPWLGIKTSHRPVYDAARLAMGAGVDEAILRNQDGDICEGTITNLFLRRGGRLLTPPLSCGLLPGVLRASLLASGQAVEARLTVDDVQKGEVLMGNALRGLIPARLVL